MNSYQKRKQELAYYKQRCKNFEKCIKRIVFKTPTPSNDIWKIIIEMEIKNKQIVSKENPFLSVGDKIALEKNLSKEKP